MAPKKQQTALVPTRFTPSTGGNIVPTNHQYPMTKAERRGGIEARKQLRTIDYERAIAAYGQKGIEEMNVTGYAAYASTVDRMTAIRDSGNRPADAQAKIDRYWDYGADRAASYIDAATELGVTKVLRVMENPTYSPTSYRDHRFRKNRLDDE